MNIISMHQFIRELRDEWPFYGKTHLCPTAVRCFGSGGRIALVALLQEVYPNIPGGNDGSNSMEYMYESDTRLHCPGPAELRVDFFNRILRRPDRLLVLPSDQHTNYFLFRETRNAVIDYECPKAYIGYKIP